MKQIKERFLGGKDLESMTLSEREKLIMSQMLGKNSKKFDEGKENI